MKVYISSYRDHWLSPYTILEKICFWRVYDQDDPVIERWADRLTPVCLWLQRFLDRVHPPVRYVKLDRYDTWSMDHTLAYIILPMLRQLKATQQGSAQVDPEDVPEHLRPTEPAGPNNGYTDNTVHERWAWVMDEMIWAFEQKLKDDDEHSFYDHSGVDRSASFQQQIGQIKVDRDALQAHQDRKQNAFRLFGKYYQNLWD